MNLGLGLYLHAFAARYDLPISFALYLFAAAGVVLSFVMVALFAGESSGDHAVRYPRLPAPPLLAIGRSAASRAVIGALGVPNALLSQHPMLVLMVLYSMTSLGILAQPITRDG